MSGLVSAAIARRRFLLDERLDAVFANTKLDKLEGIEASSVPQS
jgi:hypothetical protein